MRNSDWYAHYEEQESWFNIKEYDVVFPNHNNTKPSEVTITYIKDIE